MHEFSLICGLLQTVIESAEKNEIKNVTRVKLIVGECHGALPEALSFAFNSLCPDTVCQGAELDIDIKEGVLLCTACGHKFPYAALQNMCPGCGSLNPEIISGGELLLEYFEGE